MYRIVSPVQLGTGDHDSSLRTSRKLVVLFEKYSCAERVHVYYGLTEIFTHL
jgi:hypothetical protein